MTEPKASLGGSAASKRQQQLARDIFKKCQPAIRKARRTKYVDPEKMINRENFEHWKKKP